MATSKGVFAVIEVQVICERELQKLESQENKECSQRMEERISYLQGA